MRYEYSPFGIDRGLIGELEGPVTAGKRCDGYMQGRRGVPDIIDIDQIDEPLPALIKIPVDILQDIEILTVTAGKCQQVIGFPVCMREDTSPPIGCLE